MLRKIAILCAFLGALNAEFIGEAAYSYGFYRYTEPGLMKIEGTLQLATLKLGYFGKRLGIETNFAHSLPSSTKYIGQTMSGTPVNAPSRDDLWALDVRLGTRRFVFGNHYDGLTYIGAGYRYLKNKVQHAGGYTREQDYIYLPFGFYYVDESPWDDIYVRYGVELRYAFLGRNKTHIGEVLPSIDLPVLRFTQKNNFGSKVYVGLEYDVVETFRFFVQFSADYWYVNESNSVRAVWSENATRKQGYFYEPKNNTVSFAIEAGFGF